MHYSSPCSLKAEASGVYCALCVLLRQMEVEGCVDVVTTCRYLREQRPGILTSQVGGRKEGGREGRGEGGSRGQGEGGRGEGEEVGKERRMEGRERRMEGRKRRGLNFNDNWIGMVISQNEQKDGR